MSLLNEARRMQKLAGVAPPRPTMWSFKDPRSAEYTSKLKTYAPVQVGDQVEYYGRIYNVERVSDFLAHLSVADPKDIRPEEIEKGDMGRVSINPKYLQPKK